MAEDRDYGSMFKANVMHQNLPRLKLPANTEVCNQ